MKRLSKFGVVAGVIAAFAAVSVMAAEVTVGQFVVEIAKVKNVSAGDPESAVRGLQATGVNLSGLDLRKSLTEGDVARIASAVGIKVTTSRPEATFSQRQVDSFVQTFGSDLNTGGDPGTVRTENTTRTDPQPGKGKSKGFRSPSEPI